VSAQTKQSLDPVAIERLREQIQGAVLMPGEPGYDQARTGWDLSVQQRPALILLGEAPADIAEGMKFAVQQGLWAAVQSTGHGVIQPADDNLLIITSRMQKVDIDPATATARIEAGARWDSVLEKAQQHGLAPLLGSSPTVGAIGYTLGGGLGWLARKYGLAADSVRALEVVTTSGEQLRLTASENSELFWALCGGGGGFAIVTAMEIQLFPVTRIYAGSLMYPPAMVKAVFQHYRAWVQKTPEEMTSSIQITNFPKVEMVPEFLRGKSFVIVKGCFCGPERKGQTLIRDWLDWQKPLENSFHSMPFGEVASISNDPPDPLPAYYNGCWLQTLEDAAIDALIEYGLNVNGSSPLVFSEVRHIAGAMGREAVPHNAFGYREAPFLLDMVAFIPNPEWHPRVVEYGEKFKQAIEPFIGQGIYLNFLNRHEILAGTRKAFPSQTLERLRSVKMKYDPQNLLRSGYPFLQGDD